MQKIQIKVFYKPSQTSFSFIFSANKIQNND